MRNFGFIILFLFIIASCSTPRDLKSKSTTNSTEAEDYVRIANDSLDYEIIIYDSFFRTYLNRQQPGSFYDLDYLEAKNAQFINTFNRRAYSLVFSKELYPNSINYEQNVHYGKEVNFLLYNYLIFFQEKYNQKL